MSGGRWDYLQIRILMNLQTVANDEEIIRRFPKLSISLEALSRGLYEIIRALDYDLSGDSMIKDDEEFQRNALNCINWGERDE